MRTIRLWRKDRRLYIGDSTKDISSLTNTTLIYDVSHVKHNGDGWYDIYNGKMRIGFVTAVENVEERW